MNLPAAVANLPGGYYVCCQPPDLNDPTLFELASHFPFAVNTHLIFHRFLQLQVSNHPC
jgi:hypothetical protein